MPTKGQPIAEGTYTTSRGPETIRHETWQLARMAHGAVLTSKAEILQPQPMTWSFDYTVTQNWVPAQFSIHLTVDGKTIASDQRIQAAQYVARTKPAGQESNDQTVDFDSKSQLDYDSPLFTVVTLFRLNLQVGQTAEVDAVRIAIPELEPRRVKLKYVCVAEESIEIPAGKFSAWHYTVGTDGESAESHFWADRNGIVLQYRYGNGDETKITRYRRIDRR